MDVIRWVRLNSSLLSSAGRVVPATRVLPPFAFWTIMLASLPRRYTTGTWQNVNARLRGGSCTWASFPAAST